MSRTFPSIACFLAASVAGWAQDVDVTTVRFNNVRAPNGNWLEMDITLNVKPPHGSPGGMVSRVRVSVVLGFESPAPVGGERRTEYYRAQAECVALEAGRADVRFYLPPEIVRRDQLRGDPRWWSVELAAGGRAMPPGRAAFPAALSTAEQRKAFLAKANAAAPANDGLLLPQFLTPFANEYPRATPSFVRREAP